jgi:transposase
MTAAISDRRRNGPSRALPKIPAASDRMRQIHRDYCDGQSTREIAIRLGTSRHWIEQIVRRVHEENREARLEMVRRRVLP